MTYVGEWIKHIVLIILVATFLDLLLPNTEMRRYIQLVIGLIIIVLILSPILELLHVDQERLSVGIEELLKPQEETRLPFEEKSRALQEAQESSIIEEVERLWALEIKREVESVFTLHVEEVEVELVVNQGEPDISYIKLVVAQHESEKNSKDDLVQVEPVAVMVGQRKEAQRSIDRLAQEEPKWTEKLLTYFDQNWNISGDKIEIFWTGG